MRRLLDFQLGETRTVGLVVLAGIISGISFLFPGYPMFGDVWPHLVRAQIAYEAFRAGHLPGWSFFFYNGYPLLRFYSPLFYYLVGAFGFITGGDVFAATKIALFLLHVASGVAAYYLARRALDDDGAFIAAFGYLFSYWHLMFVSGFGQYPAGLVFALIPLSLWLLDRLAEQPSLARMILAGFGIALLPLTHVFYAYFWIPFLVIWFLPLVRKDGARPSRVVPVALGAGLFAVLLAASFVVPFFIEGQRYRMPLPAPNSGAPSVLTLVGLSQEMSGYSGSYVGLAILLLAAAGITRRVRERKLLADASFWGLLLSVGLAFSGYLPIISRIPLVGDLPSERFLIFALLFAALLAGAGYQMLRERLAARWLWIPLVVLIALDIGPRLYTNVYRSADRVLESRDYIYEKLSGRQDGRFLDVPVEGRDPSRRFSRYPAEGFLFAGMPSIYGPPYHQFAPRSMLYAYAWAEDVAGEFLDSTREALSERALCELRLLDAKYVVTLPTHKASEQGVTYVFLKQGLIWNDTLLRRVMDDSRAGGETDTGIARQPFVIGTFEGAAPVIVAPRVVSRNSGSGGGTPRFGTGDSAFRKSPGDSWDVLYTYYIARDWADLPDKMDLDPRTGIAGRIITEDFDDSLPPGAELDLAVSAVKLQQERVDLQLAVSVDCYARLAYSYYPELQVLVDGVPVRTRETADHFLLIRLPAGRHSVIIRPLMTRLRITTGIVSAAALVLGLLGLGVAALKS